MPSLAVLTGFLHLAVLCDSQPALSAIGARVWLGPTEPAPWAHFPTRGRPFCSLCAGKGPSSLPWEPGGQG